MTARMTNEQRQLECRLQSLRPEFASGRRESLAFALRAFTRRCANRVVGPSDAWIPVPARVTWPSAKGSCLDPFGRSLDVLSVRPSR